jgi:hypothetical protein
MGVVVASVVATVAAIVAVATVCTSDGGVSLLAVTA